MNNIQSKPKFKKGDKIVMLPTEKHFYMLIDGKLQYPAKKLADYEHDEITSEANWHVYPDNPNGGYWEYDLLTKANACPEDFLALYDSEAIYYVKPENV